MHKWKLFKKSAALVLSSAVIASGVPVTAMASEAEVFSDVSGETQGETAQEEGENEDEVRDLSYNDYTYRLALMEQGRNRSARCAESLHWSR